MTGEGVSTFPALLSLLLLLLLLPHPAHVKNVEPKKGLETSPLTEVEVVEGGRVVLPCDVNPPISSDDTILVLFYRGSFGTPIYSVDGRNGPVRTGEHWLDKTALENRAQLDFTGREQGLVVDPVRASDHDQYRCRVDYRSHPTRNVRVQLHVIVPPRKVRVLSEAQLEVSGVIGPYVVGSSLTLHCHAHEGRPPPRVTWWTKTTLLDDISEDRRGDLTINTLTIPSLSRADLYRVLTCQASNSNLSTPTAISLSIDMIFPPVTVKITMPSEVLEEGSHYRLVCESTGSRPKADITWWKDAMLMTDAKTQVFQEGNMTRSTLKLTPTLADHDTYISCRAQNPLLKSQVIEDTLKLDVQYKPRLSLAAGQNLDMEDIKEGDDVYFECGIKANPRVYKVQWFHDRKELTHKKSAGVIKSNQTLVLQSVTRQSSGQYSCSAANLQGSGASASVELRVKFAPTCVSGQKVVYGAGKHEQLNVTCGVEAYPEPNSFRWAFNSSSEVLEISGSKVVQVEPGLSQVSYTPRSHLDYGSLLCWAKNNVATQTQPCIFHIIHAAPPDPVNNCTVENVTSTSVDVKCQAGWDGGLTQTFTLSVAHARAETRSHDPTKKAPRVLANTSTSPRPEFSLADLEAGTEYILTIMGVNKKGQSEPVRLAIFTLRDTPEQRTSPVVDMVGMMTSVVGMAAGMVISLVVVCVVMVLVVVVRARRSHHHHVPSPQASSAGGAGAEVKKMVYEKETASPTSSSCQARGTGAASEELDADDHNPDLIPVSHDQQLKENGQRDTPEEEKDSSLKHHSLQPHDLQFHALQHSDLQHHDLQHSDLQRHDLQHSDLQQRHHHDESKNHPELNLAGSLQDLKTREDQGVTAASAGGFGGLYQAHRPLLQQRPLMSGVGEDDPMLVLGRSLVTSLTSGGGGGAPPVPARTSPYSHTRSSSLDPHSMSSTPTSPSYDVSYQPRSVYPPLDGSQAHATSTLPRRQPILPQLSYKRQFSISNLSRSTSRDLPSPQSFSSQGVPPTSNSSSSSRPYAQHRLSLGGNDFSFLDRAGGVSGGLSASGRHGSASALTYSPERESDIGPLIAPHRLLEDFDSQRESEV